LNARAVLLLLCFEGKKQEKRLPFHKKNLSSRRSEKTISPTDESYRRLSLDSTPTPARAPIRPGFSFFQA